MFISTLFCTRNRVISLYREALFRTLTMSAYDTRLVTGSLTRKSYAKHENIPLPRANKRTLKEQSHWKEGWYPAEVTELKNGLFRVHYKGWDKSFDEVKTATDIKEIDHGLEPHLKIFQVSLKESLTSSRRDSKIVIRQQMQANEFETFRENATLYKLSRKRTVYTIACRQQFERILGSGWDYRIVNEEGDNFFIKTTTVRFWFSKRKNLCDFLAYPDHVEPQYLDRGSQLVFSFVKAPGNKRLLPDLLNNDCNTSVPKFVECLKVYRFV